ncbi:MAG: GNAT family N-acetyltransferase [Eubacteriales bacterium]|nr:GNAT family N-acetyltransferase [Eubacteriales bacterium]
MNNENKSMKMQIKEIERHEIPLLISLIEEMAEFEKLRSELSLKAEILEEQIFDRERAKAALILLEGIVAGYCIYFYNFSSFMGRSGLYIEDIYLKPAYRGKGYGKQVFDFLEAKAGDEGCARMEWACLNWNRKAIDFYERNGAVPMKEWIIYRKKLI